MTCHCSDSFKHVQYITYKYVTTKLVLIIFLNWIILQILCFICYKLTKNCFIKTTLKYLSLLILSFIILDMLLLCIVGNFLK